MDGGKIRLSDVLIQIKDKMDIKEDVEYTQVTITNKGKIKLRGYKKGSSIGTKRQTIIKKGWFIYSRLGVHEGSFGIIPSELDGAIVTGDMPVFKILENKIEPDFLIYSLKLPSFESQLKNLTRGLAQTRVREKFFLNLKIILPSINEQRKILEKLNNIESRFNRYYNNLIKNKQLVQQFRQKIIQDSIQGKLVDQDSKDESSIKMIENYVNKQNGKNRFYYKKDEEIDSWTRIKLENFLHLAGRIGWKGLKASEYTKDGPLFLSVHSLNYGDIVNLDIANHISNERYEESPEIKLKENDILLCKDGAGIGKIGIVKNLNLPATVNSSLLVIRTSEIIIPEFLYYVFLSPSFQEIVQSRIMGSATPHLFQRDIKKFEISVPPLNEQKRIIQKIETIKNLCDRLEKKIDSDIKNSKELMNIVIKEKLFTE